MTSPMDHDTCSRLLRAYVTGDAGEDAPAIAAHLQDCRQCQVERAGLEILLAPVDPLTEAERAHLHAGVAAATRPPITAPSPLAPVPAPGGPASRRPPGREDRPSGPVDLDSRRVRRFAPALSAGAAILLVLSGVILFQHVGTSRNTPSASGAVHGAAPQGARSGPGAKPGAPSTLPLPAFRAGQLADIDQVQAQAAPLATAFSRAYSGSQIEQLAPGFLRRLVHLAPLQHRNQVRDCGDRFLKASGGTAIPLLGSRTTVDNTAVLALAFASSSSTPGKPLTRLTVEAWPLGACHNPVVESSAAIAR